MSEKTFNNVKITSSFDIPETRENLVSGETIGSHFGKIAKVIADLENGDISCPANGGNAADHKARADIMSVKAQLPFGITGLFKI